MPLYSVDVKMFVSVQVEAPNKRTAREHAEEFVGWTSPTDEQVADYNTDHDGKVTGCGGFDIDGTSDVELAD